MPVNYAKEYLIFVQTGVVFLPFHVRVKNGRHYSNFEKLQGDVEWCRGLRKALEEETPEAVLTGKDLALMRYAGKLTKTPGEMVAEDVLSAKREGASDEEVLEVNQVCAYFNYSNRTLNGLGVSTEGDTIGYYQK